MIPSRLFSINAQEELNAIYLLALLKYFDNKCDIQTLVYALYLLKNGDFSSDNMFPDEFITSAVNRNISNFPVINNSFKKGIAFLLQHKLIKSQNFNNTLIYCLNKENAVGLKIPERVDKKAKKVVCEINQHDQAKLKILFRKQEHPYE